MDSLPGKSWTWDSTASLCLSSQYHLFLSTYHSTAEGSKCEYTECSCLGEIITCRRPSVLVFFIVSSRTAFKKPPVLRLSLEECAETDWEHLLYLPASPGSAAWGRSLASLWALSSLSGSHRWVMSQPGTESFILCFRESCSFEIDLGGRLCKGCLQPMWGFILLEDASFTWRLLRRLSFS